MTPLASGRRARSATDKAARRASLIAAARRALARSAFDASTMDAIASAAGVAKGTAYLYFQSKESLALSVAADELSEWSQALTAALDVESRAEDRQLAVIIANSFAARPLLLRMMRDLHAHIEPGSTAEELLAFKHLTLEKLGGTAASLAAAAGLSPERAADVLVKSYVFALGLAQLVEPDVRVQRVLDSDPALAPFRFEFARDLIAGILAFLADARSAR